MGTIKWTMVAMLIVGMIIASVSMAGADTIHVNDDACPGTQPSGTAADPYCKIQDAIDVAISGEDEVLVYDGTYVENINFGGRAITVRSENGADSTTIDGNANGSVVTFENDEGSDSVLDGFTITNGNASSGGGIFCYSSSPTITNCTISGNFATGTYGNGGGGIFCDNSSSPSITNCTISGNFATGTYGDGGGGIFCDNSSSPSLSNCTISGNSASRDGGGISCSNSSSPSLINCTISGNSASNGGGIYCDSSSPLLSNCTISGNSATRANGFGGGISCSNSSSPSLINCIISGNSADNGGGISCLSSSPSLSNCTISGNSATGIFYGGGGIICFYSSPSLSNCTISGNSATGSGTWGGHGGGIYCYYSSPSISNCTISGNSASNGGGIYCNSSSPYIVNTILWNNGSEIYVYPDSSSNPKLSYCDIQGGYEGLGNIDNDPLFKDPRSPSDAPTSEGDYSLKSGSLCINAGHPRMYDSDSSRSDIGASGGGGGWDTSPINIIVDNNAVCPDSGTEGAPFCSIQNAIDYSIPGDTITVFPGTYTENLVIVGKDISLISRDGADSTTIDGDRSGAVIVMSGVGPDAELQGFTIQNGSALYGGGISCWFSSPRISNCIISGNSAYASGGGIYCFYSSPSLGNCTISGNSADKGGGIYCFYSSPSLGNCTISGNSATGPNYGGYGGGGIYCENSSPSLTNCTVSGNSATGTDCDGGGIYCYDSSPSLTNCTISGNSASRYGGGIYCFYSSPSLTNCTISGNSADRGGGIYCYSSSPSLINCTLSGNSATNNGGGFYLVNLSRPIVVNSILWGDTAGESPNEIYLDDTYGTPSITITYSDIEGGDPGHPGSPYPGTGNIDADPLFVDPQLASNAPTPQGDYHLQSGSPCIDTGHIWWDTPTDDIDGDTRPIGEDYDMGSDEVVCPDADSDNFYGVQECDTEVDCNDHNAQIYPGAAEVCDGADNDCDGQVDNNLTVHFNSLQEGVCAESVQTCNGADGWVDDYTGENNYEATEFSCDGLDNDCNGSIDEGCDDDNDDYCDLNMTVVGTPATCSNGGGDCDDEVAAIYPGAPELCDGEDNDCDGLVPGDEIDEDGDGVRICEGDCDDTDNSTYPKAPELCDDIDNDCDGETDEVHIPGDVDEDGDIDIDDVFCSFKKIMGRPSCLDGM